MLYLNPIINHLNRYIWYYIFPLQALVTTCMEQKWANPTSPPSTLPLYWKTAKKVSCYYNLSSVVANSFTLSHWWWWCYPFILQTQCHRSMHSLTLTSPLKHPINLFLQHSINAPTNTPSIHSPIHILRRIFGHTVNQHISWWSSTHLRTEICRQWCCI